MDARLLTILAFVGVCSGMQTAPNTKPAPIVTDPSPLNNIQLRDSVGGPRQPSTLPNQPSNGVQTSQVQPQSAQNTQQQQYSPQQQQQHLNQMRQFAQLQQYGSQYPPTQRYTLQQAATMRRKMAPQMKTGPAVSVFDPVAAMKFSKNVFLTMSMGGADRLETMSRTEGMINTPLTYGKDAYFESYQIPSYSWMVRMDPNAPSSKPAREYIDNLSLIENYGTDNQFRVYGMRAMYNPDPNVAFMANLDAATGLFGKMMKFRGASNLSRILQRSY